MNPGEHRWLTSPCRTAPQPHRTALRYARKVLSRLRLSDTVFRNLTRGAAILVLVLLGGIIAR